MINNLDRLLGAVAIGKEKQWMCIPGNTTLLIPGYTSKMSYQIRTLFTEQVKHSNVPSDIKVSICYVVPK